MNLVEVLEAGRQDFLESVSGLSDAAAVSRPSLERWSVLECIEHVVKVEERFLGWLQNGAPIAPSPNPQNEDRLFGIVTDRSNKATAVEAVVPSGRFHSLPDALVAFNAARDRSVDVVKDRGEALYAVGAKHQRFGDLNGMEVVQLIAGHARRHAMQIRETRAVVEHS